MENSLQNRQSIRNQKINLLEPKIYNIIFNEKKYNFIMIKNFFNIILHHFENNEIKFINNTNNKNNSEKIKDFRNCTHFKDKFLNTSEKTNLILYNLYMDSTNLSRNKKKKKDILCIYLTFLNDTLQKINKKFIYNVGCISGNIIQIIGLQTFLKFLFEKIKIELEPKNLRIKNELVKIFLYNLLGDNLEIYSCLNYKICFGRGEHSCRICDVNTKNYENLLNVYDDYVIRDKKVFNHEINMIKINIKNKKYYPITGTHFVFLIFLI
jgi:hypothetical protein